MNYLDEMKSDPSKPLSESDASWLTIAGALTEAAFEVDLSGCFSAFSPGAPFGYPAARLVGVAATLLISLPGEKTLGMVLADIRDHGRTWQGAAWMRPPIGEPRSCWLALAPRQDAGKRVTGVYGMVFSPPITAEQAAYAHASRVSEMLDEETGIWSARVFIEEATRRFDRLDVEELPGTLILLGFCRASAAVRPAIAMRLVNELRETVRPTDLLGRIDDCIVALWCDGMDQLTGAERATRFCNKLPAILPERAVITAGLVPRWPGSHDVAEVLLERAGVALRLADLATERLEQTSDMIGAWRVWQND